MSSATQPIQLSIVDMSPEALSNPNSRRESREKLIENFTNVGFCLITGLSDYDKDELFKWTQWFYYKVPEAEKFRQLATKAFNETNNNIYRGYFPLVPHALSHKRGYDIGPEFSTEDVPPGEKGNPFTEITPTLHLPGQEDNVKEFYRVIRKHQMITKDAAKTIMTLIAEAGGEDGTFFDHMFEKCPMYTFRPIMYPKREEPIPQGAYLPDGRILSTPAHVDSGFLTLLQTFGYPGLEIQLNDKWFSVSPNENALVVNLGEQMTEMSNGRFKSTIHRVIDIGKDRFSLPLFYEPSYSTNINTKIPRSLLPEGSEKKYPETGEILPYATFLLNKLPIYVEYASICDNLPEWMREKYLDAYKTKTCWAVTTGIETDGQARRQQLDQTG